MSSVIDGFEEFREAARQGVEAAGGMAILVNEDFPAQNTSSRNACLDGIKSCDYVLTIVGSRGGWVTPSGLLVVEEEFNFARRASIPVLAFVGDSPRDPAAVQFVERLSDYIDGRFRVSFRSPADLRFAVERAVRERIGKTTIDRPVTRDLSTYFSSVRGHTIETPSLRFVLAPEREEELIDPVRFASSEFHYNLLELAHAAPIRLFDFALGKTKELKNANLSFSQSALNAGRNGGRYVRLDLSTSGLLIINADVSRQANSGPSWDAMSANVLALEDIEEALLKDLQFAAALLDVLDPYKRQERFDYNVGLAGLGYRQLERNPQPRTSMIMNSRSHDQVRAYEQSRLISRPALTNSREEILRTMTILEQRAAE